MNCPRCEKHFPEELIQQMCVNGDYIDVCPICALRIRNQIHGMRKDTPFTGTNAHAMFVQAVEHLQETGQRPQKWAVRVAQKPKADEGFLRLTHEN